MKLNTPGYPPEGLDAVGKRVGFDLSQFRTKSSPEAFWPKFFLIALTGVLLSLPFLAIALKLQDWLLFLGFCAAGLAIIDLVGGFYTYYLLQTNYKEWAGAVRSINAVNSQVACQAIYDTLYNFRVLLKWRRHLKYTSVFTEFVYLSLITYTLLAVAVVEGIAVDFVPDATRYNYFGELAIFALAYYGIAYLIRNLLLSRLVSLTDNLDPTIQICWVLADLHQRYDDCASRPGR